MSAGPAGRAAAVAAGVALSTGAVAECRAREEGTVILEAEPEWQMLEDNDIEEATKLVSRLSKEYAGSRAMDLAKRMAQKPGVQAALAEEMGLSRREALDTDLRATVETLSRENDSLRAENAEVWAKLALTTDLDVSFVDESEEEEKSEGEETLEEPGEDSTSESEDDFATIDEEKRAQEIADRAYAEYLATLQVEEKMKAFPAKDDESVKNGNGQREEEEYYQSKAQKADEEDPSLVEIALALAGIIFLVAVTRKCTPFLAKKVALLSAAALAGVATHFKRP